MSNGVRLLLIGPPGAGKGTQSAKLSAGFGIPAISTGDIFRHNVKNKTSLGLKATAFMDAGDNVPDSLTNDLITDRLEQPDCQNGFLLDGYPRTTDQVRHLDGFLGIKGTSLDAVVQLIADVDVVVDRLGRRAVEQGRSDDDESVVRHRLEVYEEQTAPLVDVYRLRGLLDAVDGLGEIPEVASRIMARLSERGIFPSK